MHVRPQHAAGDVPRGVEHVVVVVPVDRQHDEAHEVREKRGPHRPQCREVGAARHFQLEDHDRDEDRDHAVAERFEPALGHDGRIITRMALRVTSGGGCAAALLWVFGGGWIAAVAGFAWLATRGEIAPAAWAVLAIFALAGLWLPPGGGRAAAEALRLPAGPRPVPAG